MREGDCLWRVGCSTMVGHAMLLVQCALIGVFFMVGCRLIVGWVALDIVLVACWLHRLDECWCKGQTH